MRRFTLIAGLAAGLLAFGGVADRQPKATERSSWHEGVDRALVADTRKVKVGTRLHANTDEETRLIVPDRCESEGEADLHLVAETGTVEESYVLVSDLCLWIEVGHSRTKQSALLDADIIYAVRDAYRNLALYHVHVGALPDLENHLPAYADLITLVLVNAPLVWTPGTVVKHRIVTTLGIVEYEFADHADVRRWMDYLKGLGLTGYEAQNLANEYARPHYRRAYYAEITRCKAQAGTIQERLSRCSPFHTDAFTIRFRPRSPPVEPGPWPDEQ